MGIELNVPKSRNPVPPGCHESFGEGEGGMRCPDPSLGKLSTPAEWGEKGGGARIHVQTPQNIGNVI